MFFKHTARKLTNGEIQLAQSIFQQAIHYEKVRIYRRKYLPFQHNHTVITPNGSIYFPTPLYHADFSQASFASQSLFLHEMTHVWQYQLGYRVKLIGIWLAMKGGYTSQMRAYQCQHLFKQCYDFSQFNMEQQGRLIEYWFYQLNQRNIENDLTLFNIMRRFLTNPRDKTLLPQTTRF